MPILKLEKGIAWLVSSAGGVVSRLMASAHDAALDVLLAAKRSDPNGRQLTDM